MKGRKPKPAAMRLLEGNREHRPIHDEPKFGKADLTPPDILNGDSLDKWHELAPKLLASGVLTEVDRDCLARYCVAYATYREAQRQMGEHGKTQTSEKGVESPSPWVGISDKAETQMNKLAAVLWLSPGDRARAKLPGKPGEADELGDFLASGEAKPASGYAN